jgi:hypothetical protein
MAKPGCQSTFIAFWLVACAAGSSRAQPVEHGAIWAEPLGSVFLGAAGFWYVSGGLDVVLQNGSILVIEGAYTRGGWYGCESRSAGGFVAVGVRFFPAGGSRGWYIQPKLRARRLSTWSAGGTELASDMCGAAEAEGVNGEDAEIGLGLDFGYRFRLGPLVLEPVIGVYAGVCLDCLGGSFFHTDFDMFEQARHRRTALAGGLNLNLLRVGIAF